MKNLTRNPTVVAKERGGKRLWRWLKTTIITLLVITVVLLLTGMVYQAFNTAADNRRYPPRGRRVDVGGHQLHIFCVGQGSPTVILEAAAQGSSAHWVWVQPEVAKVTQVCAYDRAGMGWSDMGPEPRDAHQIATELHTLLVNGGVAGPYVLVGHSFGGLFARMYAAQFPDEVVGVVLVEATHPDIWDHLPPELALPSNEFLAFTPLVASVGFTRLTGYFPAGSDLPAQQQAEITAFNASTKFMQGFSAELRAFPGTKSQVRSADRLEDIPLVVLTAENTYDELSPELATLAKQVWQELQADLATLSSNKSHRYVAGATHQSLVMHEVDAQATVGAILQVVEAVRTNRPLMP